jgi:phosphoadenosine phosphosulfate reductase
MSAVAGSLLPTGVRLGCGRPNGQPVADSPPIDELAVISRSLDGKSPEVILRWAIERYHPRLTMATAFGAEGCCLIHMIAEIEPSVRIFNLDTGYQFPETLELRQRIKDRYGIEVELVQPELSVPEYEAKHKGPLYVL